MSIETRIQGMFPYRVMQHGETLSSCFEAQFTKICMHHVIFLDIINVKKYVIASVI